MLMILPLLLSLLPCQRSEESHFISRLCGKQQQKLSSQQREETVWILCLSLVVFLSFTNTNNTISHSFPSFFLSLSESPIICLFSLSLSLCLFTYVPFFCVCQCLFLFWESVSSLQPQVGSTSSIGYTPLVCLFSSFLHRTYPPPPPHLPPPSLSLHSPASTPCL